MRYLILAVLCLGLMGCPKDSTTPNAPLPPSYTDSDVQELVKKYQSLSEENKKLLQADSDRRVKQQAYQKTVKKWLYTTSVVLGLLVVFGLLARLLKNVPSWIATILSFIGRFIHWREIVVAAILAPACFILSWFLCDIWEYALMVAKVLFVLGVGFASWQVCHRVHTGQWDFVKTKRR